MKQRLSLLVSRALAKLAPMTPELGSPDPNLGKAIDDLVSLPFDDLAQLRPILKAHGAQLHEESHPAVMALPLVERFAVLGAIGVIGAQAAVAVGEPEKRLGAALQAGKVKEESGFLRERLVFAQALVGRAHE
jgi:hypothetical protein